MQHPHLSALNRVPRWSREKVKHIMQFYAKFGGLVSKLSYSNLKLAKMISTQKLVEASLLEREEQSRLLLSQLPDIVMVHVDGIIVYANQMAVEKTGFSREELIGSRVIEKLGAGNKEIVIRNMERRVKGEEVGDYEIDIFNKSGSLHHVIVRTSPIMWNRVPSVVMILIDITERKQMEDELHLFKDLVDHSSDAIGMSTPEGKHYYQNEAFDNLFGDIGNAIHDKNGRIIGLVGLNTDITEQRRVEKELLARLDKLTRQEQKLQEPK